MWGAYLSRTGVQTQHRINQKLARNEVEGSPGGHKLKMIRVAKISMAHVHAGGYARKN